MFFPKLLYEYQTSCFAYCHFLLVKSPHKGCCCLTSPYINDLYIPYIYIYIYNYLFKHVEVPMASSIVDVFFLHKSHTFWPKSPDFVPNWQMCHQLGNSLGWFTVDISKQSMGGLQAIKKPNSVICMLVYIYIYIYVII